MAILHLVLPVTILVVGGIFAFGAIIKTLVWWKSLAWALEHGSSYSRAVQRLSSKALSRQLRLELIQSHHGNFRPCGAKSVRLQLSEQRWFSRPRDLTFVKTPIFILEGATLAIAISLTHNLSAVAAPVAVVIALWLCLYALMLIVEAIVWYVIAKDYTRVWGDIKFASNASDMARKTLGDFKALGAVTLTAVLAFAVLISVVVEVESQSGFVGLRPMGVWSVCIPPVVSALYYVLVTMTTVGDNRIAPLSTLARGASALLQVMVLLTVGFVLSAIAARVQDRTNRSSRP